MPKSTAERNRNKYKNSRIGFFMNILISKDTQRKREKRNSMTDAERQAMRQNDRERIAVKLLR